MANKPPKPFNIETLTQRLQLRLKKHLGYGNGTLSSSAENINLNMQIPTSQYNCLNALYKHNNYNLVMWHFLLFLIVKCIQ